MEPDRFVEDLSQLAPTVSDLEEKGLSPDGARRFVKMFFCIKREHPLTTIPGTDKLLELLRNWDLTDVHIGMVCFPEPPVIHKGKIEVGQFEADPLMMNSDTGEIRVEEFGIEPEFVLWPVARNGSGFLDALILAKRFAKERGDADPTDYVTHHAVAARCAAAAGGDEYLDFYKVLVGAY